MMNKFENKIIFFESKLLKQYNKLSNQYKKKTKTTSENTNLSLLEKWLIEQLYRYEEEKETFATKKEFDAMAEVVKHHNKKLDILMNEHHNKIGLK